jgi:signal peptidase I
MPIGPTTRPGADDPSPHETLPTPAASSERTVPAASSERTVLTGPDGPSPDGPSADASRLHGPSFDGPGSDGPGREGQDRTRTPRRPLSFLRELPVLLVVAFLLALLIKSFLVQAFYIPSGSMENTLMIGDRVLVNKLVYHFHPPHREDVIVFADPHPLVTPHRNPFSAVWHWLTEGLGVAGDPQKDFIKRVIGLPGEEIEVRQGVVLIDGKRLREPYLNPVRDLTSFGPVRVPRDQLFVMGDNRANSSDSRSSLGFIPYDKVIGRAFVIIWPPSRVRWLNGT